MKPKNTPPAEVSQQTGFQSACAEYAQDRPSLDDKFDAFNPAMKQIELSVDAPLFGLKKGDLLCVLYGEKPKHGSLVLASLNGDAGVYRYEDSEDGGRLFPSRFSGEQLNELVSGVIDSVHRPLAISHPKKSDPKWWQC